MDTLPVDGDNKPPLSPPDNAKKSEPTGGEQVSPADLKLLRDQVDLLQIATAEKQKPWYQQRPSLISLLALIASVITFGISQQGASRHEIREKQEQLRRLLVDIAEIYTKGLTAEADVPDPTVRMRYLAFLNNKRDVWMDAAEALTEDLRGYVSTSEYGTLAEQKTLSSEYERADKYNLAALTAAKDRYARSRAYRALGAFTMQAPGRDVERARKYFEAAISELGDPADDYTKMLLGYTYENWAYAERNIGRLDEEFRQHVKKAREWYSGMSELNPQRAASLRSLETSSQQFQK
jgi:hypothetical protein